MNIRALLFGLIALIAAGATFFGAKNWLEAQRRSMVQVQAPKPAAPKPSTVVLVAKQNLPQGTLLQPTHLRWQAWPDDTVSDAYVLQGKKKLEDFVGAVVRQGIAGGEPITGARVVFPGERGFLAAVLEPGMRAVTVPINATSGIAGFVFPGDRVDLILTHNYDKASKTARKGAETVLADVRVLAIDQRSDDQANKPDPGRTATLEVTPKQSEIIPLITELGRLSLALRSLEPAAELVQAGADGDDPTKRKPGLRGTTFTLDTEVSRLLKTTPKGEPEFVVSVVQGGKSKDVPFVRKGGRWQTQQITADDGAQASGGGEAEAPVESRNDN
ncbi:Flp pilus assembly protein CpaB [Desertibaculum subflavum]|uniref:Flp pilus assembly protein CpaB n=1 Tax=Desertibaculum subflavum TaxID=2268458 RepID=UPI000E6602FA